MFQSNLNSWIGIIIAYIVFPLYNFAQEQKKEDFIFLKKNEYLKIKLNGHHFDIQSNNVEIGKYLTSKKLYFSKENISFSSFNDIGEIDAYTILPKGDKRVVDHIETKDIMLGGVFFSDHQTKSFTFPGVREGATTHLEYETIIKDPRFLNIFRFGTYAPIKESQFKVEFPKNVEIGFKGFNLDKYDISFEKKETKNSLIYTWTAKNVDDFLKLDNGFSVSYYIPQLVLYIKSYTLKGEKIPALRDVGDLYQWYVSLIKKIKKEKNTEVFRIAEEIIKNKSSDREKAKAIFEWAQNNITYIAFEDGLSGFIPRNANRVCIRRYGDCKDMANLLYEMLNHVGLTAYRTWIGTRDRPFSYREVPTPVVDNHMIATLVLEKDTIFLDATDSRIPFGMPSAFIQGKEALIGINEHEYRIKVVPTEEKEKSIKKITTEISISSGSLIAKERRTMTGYEKSEFINRYQYRKDSRSDEEYFNNILKLGNNKTSYSNFIFDDKQKPLDKYSYSFDLEIRSYLKEIGNKMFVNMNIDKFLSNSNIDTTTQVFGKKINHKYIRQYSVSLLIPENYKLAYLPKNTSYENEKYGYSISYKKIGNKIKLDKTVYINTLAIYEAEYKKWNDFIKSLVKSYKKNIILEKIQ